MRIKFKPPSAQTSEMLYDVISAEEIPAYLLIDCDANVRISFQMRCNEAKLIPPAGMLITGDLKEKAPENRLLGFR